MSLLIKLKFRAKLNTYFKNKEIRLHHIKSRRASADNSDMTKMTKLVSSQDLVSNRLKTSQLKEIINSQITITKKKLKHQKATFTQDFEYPNNLEEVKKGLLHLNKES